MGDLVNLRRAKKAKARLAAEDAAAANRAVFGTPKQSRDLTKARSRKARRDFEAGRLDPDKTLKY
jgi:hypothetical protein